MSSNNRSSRRYHSHLVLDENHSGRDFILSDLHGHRTLLEIELAAVKFDASVDRLISVGDLIDRGPDSDNCLELLDEPWFWCVRGNHEQMMIDAIESQSDMHWSRWLMNGGAWSLEHDESVLRNWAVSLNYLPLTITLPRHGSMIGICHAEYASEHWEDRFELNGQLGADLIWGRSRLKHDQADLIQGVDWVFSGHTIVPEVTKLGNSVFIERGVFLKNPLTLINLDEWLDASATS